MKDLLKIIFMVLVVVVVFIFKDNISSFISDQVIYNGSNKVLTYNEYYLDYNYKYVQNSDDNIIDNYQEMLNIIYTIMNSGDNIYSFYCNYENCVNDVDNHILDKNIASEINNFVHPFNSFDSINVDIDDNNKVTIKIKKLYNDDEIIFIKNYIQEFINKNINESMSNYDKVKVFHDFVINTTLYDEDNTMESYTAYNLITTGKSICGGYSDIISIYLHMLGIQNYKIASNNHVWNLVNIDGVWYHVDATWDDPVASDGNDYLLHNFFMIDTNQLLTLDTVEHTFDKNIYLEAN